MMNRLPSTSVQKLAVLAMSAASLAACTTIYTPKPGEPTTRVRLVFPANAVPSYSFGVLALDACPARPPVVANNSVGERDTGRLGMPASPAPGSRIYTEMLIPANKPLGMSLGSYSYNTQVSVSCAVAMRFEPKVGVDYEFEYVHFPAEKKCTVAVRSMNKGSKQWRRETAIRQVPRNPNGQFLYDYCAAS